MAEIENRGKEDKDILGRIQVHLYSFMVQRTILGLPYFIYIIVLLIVLGLVFR